MATAPPINPNNHSDFPERSLPILMYGGAEGVPQDPDAVLASRTAGKHRPDNTFSELLLKVSLNTAEPRPACASSQIAAIRLDKPVRLARTRVPVNASGNPIRAPSWLADWTRITLAITMEASAGTITRTSVAEARRGVRSFRLSCCHLERAYGGTGTP